jgi:hypothetical protein
VPLASALAAVFTFTPCRQNGHYGCFVIRIDGELRPNDEIEFARRAVRVDIAIVSLNSPGGDSK